MTRSARLSAPGAWLSALLFGLGVQGIVITQEDPPLCNSGILGI